MTELEPMPENVSGKKIVKHQFDHGISYQVNLSHILLAAGVFVVVLYLKQSRTDENEDKAVSIE